MVFHSYQFAVFLLVVLGLYWAAPKKIRPHILLAASYLFYGAWNGLYALLILGSTLVDFVAALAMNRTGSSSGRRTILVASLLTNLGILAVFKYYNFFAANLAYFVDLRVPFHQLLLPVGISFYTFQSMSYTIDVYRRRLAPTGNFVHFALYVSFFPQLVAGPIVRAANFLPQIGVRSRLEAETARFGIKLFLLGLFKKLVIADNLALWVDRVHLDPMAFSSLDLWTTAYAFAFQIYFDFSAYSEMAIGIAALLGFDLPENFRRPYNARNIAEFWHRWHITLSTWLRDYLYISLGGSRAGRHKTLCNLMITMILGGLWHGAAWTMLAWGTLHGVLLVGHRLFARSVTQWRRLASILENRWMTPVFVLMTFHCWALSMVLFRSASIRDSGLILKRMFVVTPGLENLGVGVLVACLLLYVAQASQEHWNGFESFDGWPLPVRTGVLVFGLWLIILYAPTESQPFLYFQF